MVMMSLGALVSVLMSVKEVRAQVWRMRRRAPRVLVVKALLDVKNDDEEVRGGRENGEDKRWCGSESVTAHPSCLGLVSAACLSSARLV